MRPGNIKIDRKEHKIRVTWPQKPVKDRFLIWSGILKNLHFRLRKLKNPKFDQICDFLKRERGCENTWTLFWVKDTHFILNIKEIPTKWSLFALISTFYCAHWASSFRNECFWVGRIYGNGRNWKHSKILDQVQVCQVKSGRKNIINEYYYIIKWY